MPKDAIHMGKRYDTVDSTRGSYLVNMNYLVKNYRKGE